MAVSLVSTGVQFPDSSIQTSAAAAPPGATAIGSVIRSPDGNYGYLGYAANPTVSNTRNWTYLPAFPSVNGGTVSLNNGTSTTPIYSSYYGGWLNILNINSAAGASISYICLSINGIGWVPIMRALSGSFNPGTYPSYGTPTYYNRQANIAVDETTGRIWSLFTEQSSYYLGTVYQTTIGDPNSTWTNGQVLLSTGYSQMPEVNAFTYVNMGGVTANSGIVFNGKAYQTGNRIFTIPAGSTTATSRFSGSGPANNNYGGNTVWSYSGLKAFSITVNGQGCCSVTTNVNQNWTSMTNLTNAPNSNQTGLQAMSTSYNVYGANGSTLYYSTTFGSWTATNPGLGTLLSLTHNGTYWLLCTSQGMFYSSSATPTSWTAAGWVPSSDGSTSTPFALRQY